MPALDLGAELGAGTPALGAGATRPLPRSAWEELIVLLLLPLLLLKGGSWGASPLRPLCRPTNATLAAESDACPVCVTFTTTICAGYCPSMVRVIPAALPPGPQLVCTYRELSFSSIRLPGCPPGVDPVFSFPVALSCTCGSCRLSHSDCGGPRARPHLCTRPQLSLQLL
ncbi:lutropin subunit beta isoform X1 [Phascolarctos cinereus]|uniref:Lutropin subunit beta n=1 Tax=Phascolarctos cinereus TaxID=38626 RepID=A0A6P5LLD5_PHACI|nr:lutropin subunit beta [Phascolarctos cinereus]